LLRAEHDRQLAGLVEECGVLDDIGALERDPEEEPQRSPGVIENGDVRAVRRQMQLKASDVLEARRVGRLAEEDSKSLDGADIALLGLWRQLADRHVFDHAPPQWAHGLVGHGDAPVLSEVVETPHLRTGRPDALSCWL